MAQTDAATYAFAMGKGQAGQLYDMRSNTVVSFAAEEALSFGDPVMRGTAPEKEVVKSDASAFLGVAMFTHAKEQDRDTGIASYAVTDTVNVLTKGAVLVASSVDTVVAGEAAYVTAAGAYTNVVGSNLEIGTFLQGGDTGDLVALELA
ncbi:MAG: hypothetical protein KJP02_11870 [Octadecabacter sp.]|nr:hypothetical protein [Octadecabacter sp.]